MPQIPIPQIACGIVVPVIDASAFRTRPFPFAQLQAMIDMAAMVARL